MRAAHASESNRAAIEAGDGSPPRLRGAFALTERLPILLCAWGSMGNLGSRFYSGGRNRLAVPGQVYYVVPGEFAQPCATIGVRERHYRCCKPPTRLHAVNDHSTPISQQLRIKRAFVIQGSQGLRRGMQSCALRRVAFSLNRGRRFSGCPFMSLQQSADGVAEGACSRGAAGPRGKRPCGSRTRPSGIASFQSPMPKFAQRDQAGSLSPQEGDARPVMLPLAQDLGRRCDEIEKLFDRLDRIYQSTPLFLVRSPLGQLFAERLRTWRSLYPDWAPAIALDPPKHDAVGDFDPSQLGLGLDALVMSRAESGKSREPRWVGGRLDRSSRSSGRKLPTPRRVTRVIPRNHRWEVSPATAAPHWRYWSWPESQPIMAAN